MTTNAEIKAASCPACGNLLAVPLLDPESQPLATMAWPSSEAAARALPKYPLEFVRCTSCGHVFNRQFEYGAVPYQDVPNRMYNRGEEWRRHTMFVKNLVVKYLPPEPRVVEVGCGEGEFLASLRKECPDGHFTGFDPNGGCGDESVDIHRVHFDPLLHPGQYYADLIVIRHVLEHLNEPLAFLKKIAIAVAGLEFDVCLFVEVPCIDVALQTGRLADFYYEHNSHFTSTSFRRMLDIADCEVLELNRGYNDEVIYGLVKLKSGSGSASEPLTVIQESQHFLDHARQTIRNMASQLDELVKRDKVVVIWGGTGKAATFINRFGLDAERFPLVVDSDHEKVDTYVPGMGQKITNWKELKGLKIDVIIIPMQWRARDVVAEIRRSELDYNHILIEHRGRLVDYFDESHPY